MDGQVTLTPCPDQIFTLTDEVNIIIKLRDYSLKVDQRCRTGTGKASSNVLEAKPQTGCQDDGSKWRKTEACYDILAKGFNLLIQLVDPSSGKALKKPNQNHDEVNVVIDRVQKQQTGIRGVHDTAHKSNNAHHGGNNLGVRISERDRILAHSQTSFHKGKCGINSQQKEVE
jgi:hypothetical protein